MRAAKRNNNNSETQIEEVIVLGFKPRPPHLRGEALNQSKILFRREYGPEWMDGWMDGWMDE